MNPLNLLRIAIHAMGSNKLRTFLTMLGIIIGVASVIVMLAIGQGSKKNIQDNLSEMGTNLLMVRPGVDFFGGVRSAATSSPKMTIEDFDAVKKNGKYISAASPYVSSNGQLIYGSNNWPSQIIGVNTEFIKIRNYTVAQGEMFTDRDILTSAKVCILGKTVVENLFQNGENPVGKIIRFKKIPLTVIGVFSEKGQNAMGMDQDDIVMAPFTTVQKRIAATTYINEIFVSVESQELSDQAQSSIEQVLRARHNLKDGEENDFNVRSQKELLTAVSSTSNIMTILLSVIAGISLLVGGIGIMNIMYVSVTERTREIGLRMSLGGRNVDILMQFLIESILISLTGGILGVLIGVGAAYMVKSILAWPVMITTFSIVISFLVCTVTGIFFGWYPARKAAKLDPIEALRYE